MLKIVRTVAPTAEALDMVIGSFFKENGMEYTSTLDYAPCIAGYGEFCEKRDLVYNLSECDEKILRKLAPKTTNCSVRHYYDTDMYRASALSKGVLKNLWVYVTISAPFEYYRNTLNRSIWSIIKSPKKIERPIIDEDFTGDVPANKINSLRTLHDAAVGTGSMEIFADFLEAIPDTYIVTKTLCFSYNQLLDIYDRIAYRMISDNDSEELRNEPKHIMARWIRDLPCSFLINDLFPNNCSLGGNQNESNMD